MNDLFSDNVKLREEAASKYRVFAERVRIPRKFRPDWQELLGNRDTNDGLEWPQHLVRLARKTYWPEYAFGTANAACLLVMHRPGLEKNVEKVEDLDRVLFIEPRFPVLGGIPHAHNALFPVNHLKDNPTWNNIHKYLKPAFSGLKQPWSQLMTCNISDSPGHHGEVDGTRNLQGLSILDRIIALCQPKIVLMCGGEVHKATARWLSPNGTKVVKVAHPSMWFRTSMRLPNGTETAEIVRQVLFRD